MKAQTGRRGVAVLVNLSARWGWVINAMPQPLYPRETDLEPIVQEAGCSPGPVWMGVENLTPTGIQSLDCPALTELVYQPHYPGP